MEINISERAVEAKTRMAELEEELNDYQGIITCIRALAAVEREPDKYIYDASDKEKVIDKLHNLCAKHEIRISTDGFIDWTSVEII